MGRRKNDDGGAPPEEKQPKPKKIFIATFEMWDDGEITHDLVEKVQGERGAPRSWRLDPSEFMTSVKARLAENKMKILAEICKGLSIDEAEIKSYYSPSSAKAAATKEVEVDAPKATKKPTEGEGFDFESK